MNHIVKKAGKRLYMLSVMRRFNAAINMLLTVYSTIIRPVLGYDCEVWHCKIKEYLSDHVEKIQKKGASSYRQQVIKKLGSSLASYYLKSDGKLCVNIFWLRTNKGPK